MLQGFQSTPPVKAATVNHVTLTLNGKISIHAAREGGDGDRCVHQYRRVISIHAAREGGDRRLPRLLPTPSAFQSTPPVKAATARNRVIEVECTISIHAAREGGDLFRRLYSASTSISIHAAREGGDGGNE